MKIQEPPVSCDAGRVGGGDADRDKPSCEDVPRLDLTALTEENSWGGRPVWLLSGCFCFCFVSCFSHTQDYFIPNHGPIWNKSCSAPSFYAWVPGQLQHTLRFSSPRTSFCLPDRV